MYIGKPINKFPGVPGTSHSGLLVPYIFIMRFINTNQQPRKSLD